MSQDSTPARPRQVTTAVVLAIVFDVVLLASLFDTLGRLRTPETRAALDEVLGSPPGNGLGITTAQVLEVLRAMVFVSGALAAVALVFAVFVLQRHRAARIGYTVTAALLVLTVPAAGLLPIFVALAAIPLWTRSARDWYAGRVPAPARPDVPGVRLLSQQGPPPPLYGPPVYGQPPYGPPAAPPPGAPPAAPPSGGPPGSGPTPSGQDPHEDGSSGPPPYGGAPYGTPPDRQAPPGPPPYGAPYGTPPQSQAPYGQAPYGQAPYGQAPYGQPGYPVPGYGSTQPRRDPDSRPVTVTIAAVLTWVGAGVTATLMLAFVAILAGGSDAFIREFERAAQGTDLTLSANQVLAIGWTVAAVFLVWSLAAIVLAVLAFRRSNAARIALVVSSVMTALLSLFGITSGLSAITLILGVATVVLLFTGGANQWYSRRRSHPGPLPPGPWGPPAPGSQAAPYPPPYQPPYQPPAERPKPW